jgi:hypothetical protein
MWPFFSYWSTNRLTTNDADREDRFRTRLNKAEGYGEIWDIVKDSVAFALQKRRSGMMLFLDDLPIQLGAYHPVGTNNIVLNRMLIQIVQAAKESKNMINALIYNLLLHEYLHALGEYSELEVRRLVAEVAQKCFGKEHAASAIAEKSPWALLKGIPLEAISPHKHVMEIVRNFEKTDSYVV